MSLENDLDNSPCLTVVILNYRTPTLTIDCLGSLVTEVQSLTNTQVFVVDNDSQDHSVEQIEAVIQAQKWGDWVSVIASGRNGGYAFGNNIVIRSALQSANPPGYFLLLNPDTIVRPGALKVLVDFMDEHPQVGIAGSRLEDPDGTPQISSFRFHTLFSEFDRGLRLGMVSKLLTNWVVAPPVSDIATQTDWVAGASMIIRREVFEKVGLLDEDYFMYYEELDFCLQAKKSGWSCWYIPESRVVHLVGQSSGVDNPKIPPKRLPQYCFDSRQRYFLKNHGWLYTALADFLWLFGFTIWRGRRIIQGKPDNDPPNLLEDFFRNSVLTKINITSAITGEKELTESTNQLENAEIGLWQQITEDWIAHGRDWTKPGFRAVAVQRFGAWRMKIEPKLLRAPFSIFYRFLYRFVRNVYGIEIPYTVQLGRRVIIEHQHGIIIHGNAIIGDDSIIRQGVTIGNRYLDHPFDAPKLGTRVNVGAGAKIMGNVTIGDDVNIGANAVVLSDIPSGQTAVGIPAKIL